MMRKIFFVCLLLGLTALGAHPALAGDESDGWAFQLEPYLLASSIEGDTSVGRVTGVDVSVDFGDILETLDVGAMIHFEAIKNDTVGVIVDYGFMDLGGSVPVALNGALDADVRQAVFEAFAFRRFERGDGSIDLFGGVRWWDNDVSATVDLMVLPGSPTAEIEQDWIDPVAGVRWRRPLGEKWDLALRADVGGFGVESDFTATAGASLFYDFTDSLALEFGYRSLWVDFEDGTAQTPGYFAYDTATHGPLVGLVFGF